MTRYWLMKSEPDAFSISDLARVGIEPWSGVRNYMARNHMREMSVGDGVLFHHSNAVPPGVAGLARVVRVGVVDETQFDPDGKYFEPRATRERPVWDCVDVAYVSTFPHLVSMDRMRAEPALEGMLVLKKGMRLSVQPATEAEYRRIVELGQRAPVSTPAPKAKAGVAGAHTARKTKPNSPAKPRAKPAAKRARR